MNKLYNDTAVQAIANAIRAKNGSSDTYTIAEMSTALNDLSYYAKPTISNVALATFEADGLPLNSLKVSVEAKQDLHGYDKPWVGGSGKNKMPLSFTDGSQTNGITIHKNNDGTIKITGKATAQAVITIGEYTTPIDQSIKYSGAVGGSVSTYSVNIAVNGRYNYSDVYDGDSNAVNVSANDVIREVIVVRSGYECPTSGIIFYPMVRNSTESSTFAPYSNICPISGWSEVVVSDVNDVDNPTVTQTTTIALPQTVYGAEVDMVNGVLKITDGYIASYNGETLPSTWISSMDVYAEGTTPTTGAEIVYTLASSTTVSLTPTLIKSLEGTNNLSVDCGEVIELEYFKEV